MAGARDKVPNICTDLWSFSMSFQTRRIWRGHEMNGQLPKPSCWSTLTPAAIISAPYFSYLYQHIYSTPSQWCFPWAVVYPLIFWVQIRLGCWDLRGRERERESQGRNLFLTVALAYPLCCLQLEELEPDISNYYSIKYWSPYILALFSSSTSKSWIRLNNYYKEESDLAVQ